MDTESILETVRGAIGLNKDDASFDDELKIHINLALATLVQNGVGVPMVVEDDTQTWGDFKDPTQTEGNQVFEMVKTYVFVKTKLLFDPPPPSTVRYMAEAADETLWRLRASYDYSPNEGVVE